MLQTQTVEPRTLELLKRIDSIDELKTFRLVGGTALALQYGHRQSIDLDFFTDADFDNEKILEAVENEGNVIVLNKTAKILQLGINGVKVDFVDYSRYKWLDEAIEENGVRLACDKDIAAMKVNAIMGRGTRKDFVDMFFLLKHYSLTEILEFYKLKYPNFSEYRALLSMTFFEDAEKQVMPKMLCDCTWEEVCSTIITWVKKYQSY